MLPAQSVVLLMQTDHVRRDLATAVVLEHCGREVGDLSEAVAAQRKIVGAVADAAVAEIESLLARVRWPRISVRDSLG